ncbi:MAG: two-component system response regulator [Lysobacterales bacterium CG17_big_fil_post_rev_8_21_14_2_50_64_11]|nr:MAG: two-component system response regulator [Xanthomonadales bacterium CG17_big_fil_post_rev_8_21_14_2_50_64_11]PIX61383.1 MAG: two-component system response regulator [Xanthomonadales bacterium CG_4_10_14_3_um_filter_64_11]
MRILVVDDSERLRSALATGLAGSGFAVDQAADGGEALSYLHSADYDVIVLDLMMPVIDGIGVLREIRRRELHCRVLILSARDQIGDRVQALDLGADDYLVKPFAFEELRARVQALARRRHDERAPLLTHGKLSIDTVAQNARVDDEVLPLTPKEFSLLVLLLRHRGRTMSREAVFEHLYSSESTASDKVIEVLMSTLRGKLSKAGLAELIETRRGFGYLVN